MLLRVANVSSSPSDSVEKHISCTITLVGTMTLQDAMRTAGITGREIDMNLFDEPHEEPAGEPPEEEDTDSMGAAAPKERIEQPAQPPRAPTLGQGITLEVMTERTERALKDLAKAYKIDSKKPDPKKVEKFERTKKYANICLGKDNEEPSIRLRAADQLAQETWNQRIAPWIIFRELHTWARIQAREVAIAESDAVKREADEEVASRPDPKSYDEEIQEEVSRLLADEANNDNPITEPDPFDMPEVKGNPIKPRARTRKSIARRKKEELERKAAEEAEAAEQAAAAEPEPEAEPEVEPEEVEQQASEAPQEEAPEQEPAKKSLIASAQEAAKQKNDELKKENGETNGDADEVPNFVQDHEIYRAGRVAWGQVPGHNKVYGIIVGYHEDTDEVEIHDLDGKAEIIKSEMTSPFDVATQDGESFLDVVEDYAEACQRSGTKYGWAFIMDAMSRAHQNKTMKRNSDGAWVLENAHILNAIEIAEKTSV